jgi:glycosyltransferase involved in cell wall biosynthesis
MRFLLAVMQFPTEPGRSYLTTELALALIAAGHEVEVLQLDWDAQPAPAEDPPRIWKGVRLVRCTPRWVDGFGKLVRHASKFVLSGRHAAAVAKRRFDLGRFDVMITWAPVLAFGPLMRMIRRAGVAHRLLIIWDFFPDSYHEIGRIPAGPPFWIAKAAEQRLMQGFTAVLCTLAQNAAYLRRAFRTPPGQKVLVTPIWTDAAPAPKSDRAAVRRAHGLPEEGPIAVFGGNIVEGRGFDQMLAAAEAGARHGSALKFLFVGEGRLAPKVRAAAETSGNVLWRPPMPRQAYLELLGACEVGLVATVPGVTSFTIPSKTLDYLRAGLPAVVAVEAGNEFALLLERYGVARSVAFGDAEGFLRAAEDLARGPGVDAAANQCLDEVFHVRHAVGAILDAAA